MERQDERLEFIGAVRHMLSHVPRDIRAMLRRWFAECSIGCVGILRDWLVATVAALIAEGQSSLTSEALEPYALQPGQRVRLELEARAGEQRVEAGHAASQQQLQALLGAASGPVPSTPAGAPAPGTPAARGTRPGTRAPRRDLVGAVPPQAEDRRCGFSGVLALAPAELVEVQVCKVACPECHTVCTLPPQGARVRFPYHQRRKTRTPSTDTRWVREGEQWTIVRSSPPPTHHRCHHACRRFTRIGSSWGITPLVLPARRGRIRVFMRPIPFCWR